MINERLRPCMTDEQLREYFIDRLPDDFPKKHLPDIACMGFARLILVELGGPENARIYWISKGRDDNLVGHAFVLPNNLSGRKIAFNSTTRKTVDEVIGWHTARFVRRNGADITEEVLKYPWVEI